MKPLYASLIALLLLSFVGQAQTQKDWYLIGGKISNLGLDLQKGNTSFSFDITPTVAWFVEDNFAVGAQALIGVNTGKGFTQLSYGIGPIARYYLKERALSNLRKSRWFIEANAGFNGINTKVSGSPGVSTNGLGFGIGPGLAYFLNQNIALEVLAKYNLTVGLGNATTDNAINVAIGFQIYLPKAKLKSMKTDVK